MSSIIDRAHNLAGRILRAAPVYASRPELLVARLRATRRPKEVAFSRVDYFGMSLVVMANEDIGWMLVSGDGFERAELTVLDRLLRPDDICVDVGGNIGIYATYFSARVPRGRVHSFEPVPLNAALIELNAALNQCENVSVERCALADFEGTSEFAVAKDSAFSSLRSTGRVADAGARRVKVATLDGWAQANQVRPTVLKIDVEGAEMAVLRGARELLGHPERRPRLVMVETNAENQAAYQTTPEEVVRFVRGLGYKAYAILESGVLAPEWPSPGAVEDVLFVSPGTVLS